MGQRRGPGAHSLRGIRGSWLSQGPDSCTVTTEQARWVTEVQEGQTADTWPDRLRQCRRAEQWVGSGGRGTGTLVEPELALRVAPTPLPRSNWTPGRGTHQGLSGSDPIQHAVKRHPGGQILTEGSAHIHAHTCSHIRACTHMNTCTHMLTRAHAHTHTHMCAHTCILMYVHTHMRTYACLHTCTCMCTHRHTHTSTHTPLVSLTTLGRAPS